MWFPEAPEPGGFPMSTSRQGEDASPSRETGFDKLERKIQKAVRSNERNPQANVRLDLALDEAREADMPAPRIETVRREAERDNVSRRPATFEGHGPDGVAVLVESITDDRSRTREELEELFWRHGGELGTCGSVAWQFERRGEVEVERKSVEDEDLFLLQALNFGAKHLRSPIDEGENGQHVSVYRLFCEDDDLHGLAVALAEAGYSIHRSSVVHEPTETVQLGPEEARSFLRFHRALTDHRDVREVYANWNPA